MRSALVLALVPALPAMAMEPPCHLDQEVSEAVTVIQIADPEVTQRSGQGCVVTGTVVRSFRGEVAPGTLVQTSFYCGEPTVGGISWDAEAVAQAAVVEIHAAAEGGPAGAGWGMMLLEAPTDEPAFPFEHLRAAGGRCS